MVVLNVMAQFVLLAFKTMINTSYLRIMVKLVRNVIMVVLDVTFSMMRIIMKLLNVHNAKQVIYCIPEVLIVNGALLQTARFVIMNTQSTLKNIIHTI